MSKTRAATVLLTAQTLLLCLTAGVAGQSNDDGPTGPKEGVVVTLGVGPGSAGVAAQASIWLQNGPHAGGLRNAGTSEFSAFGSPAEAADDWALLYGRRADGRRGWVRAAIGPGLVSATRKGEVEECAFIFCTHESVETTTLGVAFHADAVWSFARGLGLGVTAFGNLNGDRTFAGLTFNLLLGSVRH